jgi:hypothetical protein
LKKKHALEIFISAIVVFDIIGSNASDLPIWQFFPMWVGAIIEIEVGARVLSWLAKRIHLPNPFKFRRAR